MYSNRQHIAQKYKFKIKSVQIESESIQVYGYEDDDRLIIDKNALIQTECSYTDDEVKLVLKGNHIFTEIFMKKYLPRVDSRLEEILRSSTHMIITEGKTDWKHLKYALSKFKEKGEYSDLSVEFLEYDDELKMGENKLKVVCEYNALFDNDYKKIFIFDSDVEQINEIHKGKKYVYHGNNVYSMIIPIPDHRKEMPYISIEHYYTDSEIRTLDKNGRRLFIAYEFNADGKYYNGDNIWSLNVNKSTRQNKIIDEKVYKLKHICDKKEEVATEKDKASIALSKNDFVGYLVSGQNPFNDISIENLFP
jgi:hypothetical protein